MILLVNSKTVSHNDPGDEALFRGRDVLYPLEDIVVGLYPLKDLEVGLYPLEDLVVEHLPQEVGHLPQEVEHLVQNDKNCRA